MQVDLLALVSVEKYMGWVRDKRCGTRVREHWARTQAEREVDAGRQGGRGLQVVRVSQPVVNLIRGPCDLIVWTGEKNEKAYEPSKLHTYPVCCWTGPRRVASKSRAFFRGRNVSRPLAHATLSLIQMDVPCAYLITSWRH